MTSSAPLFPAPDVSPPQANPEVHFGPSALGRSKPIGRTYNHDLLRQPEAQAFCRQDFPTVASVLIDAHLLEVFGRFEDEARRYKRLVRRVGTLAIIFMVVAFAGAIAGVYSFGRTPVMSSWLGRLIEAASLIGLALAFLVSRWGPFRRRWMDNRFCAEVLRLWHFRRVLDGSHVDRLTRDSHPPAQAQFRPTLASMLQAFEQSGRVRRAQLSHLGIDPIGDPFVPTLPADERIRDETLRAYERLRVVHQDEFFAERADHQFNDFAGASNRSWSTVIAALTGIALAVGLATSLVTIVARDSVAWTPFLVMATIVFSIGLRSWGEGMKFEEEEDHYLRMHAHYRVLRERWRHAATPTDKLLVAQDLEMQALNELRSFLRIHDHAQFVF